MDTTESLNPETLEEAVDYLLPRFEGMEKFLKMPEEEFTSFCHSQLSGSIAMKIRNELGFWTKDTAIYKHMTEVQRLKHPDDMSELMLKMIYRKYKLNNQHENTKRME